MDNILSDTARYIVKMCGAFVFYELPSDKWQFENILHLVNSFILQERRRNNLNKDENFADMLFLDSDITEVREYYSFYNELESSEKEEALQEIKEYFKDNELESEVCFVEPV